MEKKLVIVGTAHVSQKSVEEVKRVIEEEKPQAVAVELCYRRYRALVEGKHEDVPLTEILRKGNVFLILFQLMLSYFQKKVAQEYGVQPGAEMLAAIEKAREIGADVLLIDRDISVTFRRFWSSLSVFEKLKLVWHLVKDFFSRENVDVDKIVEEDVIDMIVREFRNVSPNAAKILIDERDEYMAANLIAAMQRYSKVVAVVGAGHKKGLEKAIEKLSKRGSFDLRALEEVKEYKNWIKILSAMFAVLVVGIFALIAVSLNTEVLFQAFLFWFLINGVLAAIGAAAARAHPLSILAAFLFAWMTSLNPLIASGWISGAVEAWIRKPTSSDVSTLFEVESLREMLNNRFFRVLLVAAFTNIGSMIGTIYGGYYIITHFGVDVAKVISEKLAQLIG